MLTIKELAEINEARLKQQSQAPQMQDGDDTFLPKGASLPKFLGFTQAAESVTGTERYDPKRHKLPFDEFRNGMADIVRNGLAQGKTQSEIMGAVDEFQSLVGYTDAEMNPRLISGKEITSDQYNTAMVNPFPALKLILGLGGSVGGTFGGAVTGARIGAFGGPIGAVAGSVVGGTLGYLSGLVGYEKMLDNLNSKGMLYTPTYNEIGEFLGYQQGIDRPSQEEFKKYLAKEAAVDLAFGTAFGFFRPAVNALRPIGRKLVGVGKDEVAYAREVAETTGITPSVADVSKFELMRVIPNALGRIPIFGGGVKKAFGETQKRFMDSAQNVFYNGPTFNLAELGHDLSKVRDSISKKIIQNVSGKYDTFFDTIGNKTVLDISDTINIAKQQLARIDEISALSPGVLRTPMYEQLQRIAQSPQQMINGETWKETRTAINDLIYMYGAKGTAQTGNVALRDALYEVSKGLEKSLGKFADGSAAGPQIRKLLNDADQAYSDMVVLFGSPTAKSLGADSKFAFQALVKQPGSIESDRLFNVVFRDFQSPDAVKAMRNLMGDEMFAKGVKAKLLQTFEDSFILGKQDKPGILDFDLNVFKSFDNLSFDAKKFKRLLGLDQVGKSLEVKGSALAEALNIAGKNIEIPDAKKLLAFANAAETFFNGKNLNMSQFLARRTMLGGAGAFATAVLPIAGAATVGGASIPMTLLGIIAARKLGYLMSSPMALDAATKAMEASAKAATQPFVRPGLKRPLPISNRYALEAIETLYKQFPDLPTELDNEFNRLQAQTSEADPLAKDIYLKSQEEMDSLGTMNAVDQYLDKRYRDKGLVVPQIFGTQQQEPTSIQPSSFEEVPAVVTEPATATVAKVETQPKLNQQSRLALAGNDPLLQAIATETT
jgi:hypothetical protein